MESKKTRKIIKILCLAVFVACLLPIGQACRESMQSKAQQETLRKMTEVSVEHTAEGEAPGTGAISVLQNDGTLQEDTVVWQAGAGSEQATSTSQTRTDSAKAVAVSQAGMDSAASQAEEDSAKTASASLTGENDTENTLGLQRNKNTTPGSVKPAILNKYVKVYQENSDLAGWLSIEGMKIDYPVLQNADNEYYLHHDFYGNDSKYGCLYVKNHADLQTGTNFVIYGHNMKDGSMFGDLDLYQKESFYKEHPRISFDTLYEERTYDIIAVFRSQVYNAEDDVFKYYQFYEADTQEEFEDFYHNIKELSLYDTGVEAQFGDTFLTLSTCAYHVQDGRFVVVAKRTSGS